MPEDLEGYVTVPEAAHALGRSAEQVRRYLREGKLEGRRIGGQWFIRETAVTYGTRGADMDTKENTDYPATAREGGADRSALFARITARREAIGARWQRQGVAVDAVKLIHHIREND